MKSANGSPSRHGGRPPFYTAMLVVALCLSGCSSIMEEAPDRQNAPRAEIFDRSSTLFAQGSYEDAFDENRKIFATGGGSADVALFNMGLISAYSANPKKDYSKASTSFKTLVKNYPDSPLAEQARIWIQVLDERSRIAEERRKLLEEKRLLTREKEQLTQEREKLNYTAEKSRQVDIDIEKRRRRNLK